MLRCRLVAAVPRTAAGADPQYDVTLVRALQTVTFTTSAQGASVGGGTYAPAGSATSGLAVTITVDAASVGVCSFASGVVSFLATGTCVLSANQAGNLRFAPAPTVTQSIPVARGTQTLSFTSNAPSAAAGTSYKPTAVSSAGLPVAITSGTPAVCSGPGASGVVSLLAPGTCVLAATQAGDANHSAAAAVQQTFTVARGSQTVTLTSQAPSNAVVGGTYTPTFTASSRLAVTATVATPTVCTMSSGVVSFIGAGTCVIVLGQGGNASYLPAPPVQASFMVSPARQTLSFMSPAPMSAKVGGATYAPAAGSTSGLPVTVIVDGSTSVCALSGGAVSFLAAGTCRLNANQPGNGNYAAAVPVQQSFSVAAGP